MNVLRVELVREVSRLRTYKIIYNEDIEFETTLVRIYKTSFYICMIYQKRQNMFTCVMY